MPTPLENPLCPPISTPGMDAGLTSATVLNVIMIHHERWTRTTAGWIVSLQTHN